jgi:hypothetical protein
VRSPGLAISTSTSGPPRPRVPPLLAATLVEEDGNVRHTVIALPVTPAVAKVHFSPDLAPFRPVDCFLKGRCKPRHSLLMFVARHGHDHVGFVPPLRHRGPRGKRCAGRSAGAATNGSATRTTLGDITLVLASGQHPGMLRQHIIDRRRNGGNRLRRFCRFPCGPGADIIGSSARPFLERL